MTHGQFKVMGRREYRGHRPGSRFEARMDAALRRAIARGDIQLVAHVEPILEPGSFTLPHDWPPQAADAGQSGAPEGASLIEGGGK